jgi:hypothetical protein
MDYIIFNGNRNIFYDMLQFYEGNKVVVIIKDYKDNIIFESNGKLQYKLKKKVGKYYIDNTCRFDDVLKENIGGVVSVDVHKINKEVKVS